MTDVDIRQGLRRQLASKRASLRVSEQSFLEVVLRVGTDAEIASASETLKDDRVFFAYEPAVIEEDEACGVDGDDEENEEAVAEQDTSRDSLRRRSLARPSLHSVGSVRRLDRLGRRGGNSKIWETYESRRRSSVSTATFQKQTRRSSVSLESFQKHKSTISAQRKSIASFASDFDLRSALDESAQESEEDDDETKRDSLLARKSVVAFPSADALRAAYAKSKQDSALTQESNDFDEKKENEQDEKDETKLAKARLDTRRASVNIYGGEGFEIGEFQGDTIEENAMVEPLFDPWKNENVLHQPAYDICILGTSADDESARPHVLSPLNMEALQPHLPFTKRGESFWLKYSLVRDGASPKSFLHQVRGAQFTLLAMETLDGDVFGAFTSSPWHVQYDNFGDIGGDSFVWRMKEPRSHDDTTWIAEQAARERRLDVFKFAHRNKAVQRCTHDRLSIGGGMANGFTELDDGDKGHVTIGPSDWGFALSFEDSMHEATSSPCVTFQSPGLCSKHVDGSRFELINVEAWTLTPCLTVDEAEVMECSRLFFHRHMSA